ncbi:glycosyltransferase family 4 protein [Pseudomonas bubulae]|uniref:glycosyltransferase family 4 protein n=1 Tax=Pseudomonas bubulae TaxID=2316085 RepID=UPI001F379A57|nr:glycosyltransferase family 4 protein [Pseudomonas bubulae]MCF3195926.1 glycosyltransferase family 4 protein [Pseudomonas bubulae]
MKILIVSPDHPYPPNHGGRVDIWNRILLLSELNHEIDLVITTSDAVLKPEDETEFRRHIRNVSFFKRKIKLLPFIAGTPYQVSSRASLRNFHSNEKYDYIILESEATSEILKSSSITGGQVLLRVHNNESLYFKSLFNSSSNILKKLYYLYESIAYKKHSSRIKSLANTILHISSDELLAEKTSTKKKAIFLPPYINLLDLKEVSTLHKHKVVFIGNLFTANNINGLRWFIDSIHPTLTSKQYELIVAGNTRNNEDIIKYLKQANITFIDSPEDLSDIYKDASIFIIPLLEGAGVKLRAVNAISQGIPIVATSIGIEGLGLENEKHYLLANSSEDFSKAINRLLTSETKRFELAKNAQQHLIDNLDSKKILTSLFSQEKS